MNIGITVYPTYGGSGIVGSELGKELAARGHTIHFISSSLPTRLTELNERVRFHEVEMMSYPLFEHQPYTLALATKMAKVAETENLDLLHVHYAIPHSISAILARESLKPKRYLPVITTLHGTDITLVGADRSYLPITRYGIVQSDGVTAISHYLKEATREIFQFDEIEVIPNFVCQTDYARHPVEDLRSSLAPEGEPLLVHVSNFRPVKRPVDCVEILARVLQKGVATRLVTDGDTGFLSEVGDVEKMAADAAGLLSATALRREMGKRARQFAVTHYRTDIVIPRYIEFYERVLQKTRVKV